MRIPSSVKGEPIWWWLVAGVALLLGVGVLATFFKGDLCGGEGKKRKTRNITLSDDSEKARLTKSRDSEDLQNDSEESGSEYSGSESNNSADPLQETKDMQSSSGSSSYPRQDLETPMPSRGSQHVEGNSRTYSMPARSPDEESIRTLPPSEMVSQELKRMTSGAGSASGFSRSSRHDFERGFTQESMRRDLHQDFQAESPFTGMHSGSASVSSASSTVGGRSAGPSRGRGEAGRAPQQEQLEHVMSAQERILETKCVPLNSAKRMEKLGGPSRRISADSAAVSSRQRDSFNGQRDSFSEHPDRYSSHAWDSYAADRRAVHWDDHVSVEGSSHGQACEDLNAPAADRRSEGYRRDRRDRGHRHGSSGGSWSDVRAAGRKASAPWSDVRIG